MFQHGKFKQHPGDVKSTGSKPAPSPHEKEHGQAQAPHEGGSEKHVTETHPGQTQPHPVTGVHAFHAHHMGGGKYKSHTHHDGGNVETREHPNHADMEGAMHDALPPDEGMGQGGPGMGMDADFSNELGGIGGAGQ